MNARDIERQILRLVRIFSRKETRDKLQKEFSFLNKQANEIDLFNEQFKLLRKLMNTKLTIWLARWVILTTQLTTVANNM